MKKLPVCGFAATGTRTNCIWGFLLQSLPRQVGFLFFFPQASDLVLNFPGVASSQQPSGATQTPEAPGLENPQGLPALD